MLQNAFIFPYELAIFWSAKKRRKDTFFPTLHPLSTVIFATATVLAFVLLRDSRFNFHCYTQREATPTQKSARKCAATSHDFLRERLQSAFTLANQLRWIAQYHGPISPMVYTMDLYLPWSIPWTYISHGLYLRLRCHVPPKWRLH